MSDDEWKFQSAGDIDLSGAEARRSVRREVGLLGTIVGLIRWWLVRLYLRRVHRFEVVGTDHLPSELPVVLIANHGSHLDAPILAAALPFRLARTVFPIAAGDHFFETKISATMTTLFMNALPLWRRSCGAHSLTDLRARLVGEPCGYIVFPEGTRSRTGEIATFKPGVGRIVAGQSEVPIVPCFIEGAAQAMPTDRKLPKFGARLRLVIGAPLFFGDQPDDRAGWKVIAQDLENAVKNLANEKLENRSTPC